MIRYLLVSVAMLAATPALAQDPNYPDPNDNSDTVKSVSAPVGCRTMRAPTSIS